MIKNVVNLEICSKNVKAYEIKFCYTEQRLMKKINLQQPHASNREIISKIDFY